MKRPPHPLSSKAVSQSLFVIASDPVLAGERACTPERSACLREAASAKAGRASVAISLFSTHDEIASVASLLRYDIVTQSLGRRGPIKYSCFDEKKRLGGGPSLRRIK